MNLDTLYSCMNNYFEYKGIKGKFDVWRLIRRKNLDNLIENKDGEQPPA